MIGNTDRHTENWGFLLERVSSGLSFTLAPAFDNGTSLGYIVLEDQLKSFTEPARLKKLVAKGTHHFGWIAGDNVGAQHARLCRLYRDRYLDQSNAMDDALGLTDHCITRVVDWCCSFAFALPFTEARGRFVPAQLRARRDALAAALGA